MPLTKLTIKPGLNRDQTNYTNEGGWWACNKIRFLSGFPQKLGGWTKYSVSAFIGVCRSLFTWSAPNSYNYMAIGTNEKIYVESGGSIHDITPLRQTFDTPNSDNCISTTSGSSLITIALTSHGAIEGDYVTFSGVVGAGVPPKIGGIPEAEFNTEFKIVNVINANSFVIQTASTATSSVSGQGGTGITIKFQIHVGYAITSVGYGWGAPVWGGPPGWGVASTIPINQILRLVFFDKYGTDLFFNVRYSDIYIWVSDPIFATRAVYLSSLAGATDVPTEVGQIMFDDSSGVLIAFGSTPFGGGNYNPLLVRWSSQDNALTGAVGYKNWTVDADPGVSVAGYLQLQSGSAILQAVTNAEDIYVFTESSVTRLHYIGGTEFFSQDLVSADITLIGPNAVIAINSVIYWMGKDKFFTFSGRVETLPCTLRQHVFENINLMQADQIFAASNERYHEIWWWYCSANSTTIDSYVVFNYVEQIWYYGNCDDGMARTAWSDSPLRNYPQAASSVNNYLYNHEYGHDADDQPMTSYITSSDMDLPPDGNKFMLVRRIIPDVSFDGSNTDDGIKPSVDLTLIPRNFPGSAYMTTNQEGQTYARGVIRSTTVPVEQYTEQVFVRARARQLAFSISSSGVKGVNWQLGSPRLDMREDGLRG